MDEKPEHSSRQKELSEVIRLFLRLGFTAFGGPAAHIALMRDEVVARRKWLKDPEFLDLLGATNLIPGPNSTEMAIHLGYLRAGLPGLLAAGACFIIPALLIVTVLAWAYVRYGAAPEAGWLLYGIKPVVIAIILQALWNLGRQAVKGLLTGLVGITVLVLYLIGFNEIALLFGAALLVMILYGIQHRRFSGLKSVWFFPLIGLKAFFAQAPFSLPLLFFTFIKIGSILYGSGYVLLAFLRADFVERLGWLNEAQLIDAIAVGQVTPGPVFTTAAFIGFLLGGVPGALVAALGIFLPSFLFVWLVNPFIPRLRRSPWTGALLDGANIASLGLMAGVTLQLGQVSLIDPLTILLALLSAFLLLRFKVNSVWLILGGGAAGLLKALLTG
ncbi:MAG: chromate efflux transporter [Chloroflexi bacterium]|nr:chromate efflux transporter [Chloroflexota bacterium]